MADGGGLPRPDPVGAHLEEGVAEELWDDVADAIDMAALSAVATDDRTGQPLIPALFALPAAKALVGVFAAGVFEGLGVRELGKMVGERAHEVLRQLRAGKASEIDSDELTREAESWVAQMRASSVSEETVARAEAAVAELLIERGEDPAHARVSAHALARAILSS
jgi:hypothetical protein